VIIGLSGYARSGKDTAGSILSKRYGYERIAFADNLKKLALILSPDVGVEYINSGSWSKAKENPMVREYLQMLGTAVRSTLGEDAWIHSLFQNLDLSRNYVVTDVRFLSEVLAIRNAGGIIVRINRSGVGAANNHVSEHELDHCRFDKVINNNGSIEELASKLRALLRKLDR